jgi:hypothetical protein
MNTHLETQLQKIVQPTRQHLVRAVGPTIVIAIELEAAPRVEILVGNRAESDAIARWINSHQSLRDLWDAAKVSVEEFEGSFEQTPRSWDWQDALEASSR